MENITLEKITNAISLKSQLMMQYLKDNRIDEAEDIADDIARMIFQYRKLSESLQVDEIK